MSEKIINPNFKAGQKSRPLRRSKPYKFTKVIPSSNYFWFPRHLVTFELWRKWPASAKAILPAYLHFQNIKTRDSFPSIETLSTICGINRKTVMEGQEYFRAQGDGPYKIKSWQQPTANGRLQNHFEFLILRADRGNRFPFRKNLIENGNWAVLSQSAKALYIVLRAYGGKFPEDFLNDEQGNILDADDSKIPFELRSWEYVEKDRIDF